MSEKKYKKAARIIIKAGMLPFPVTETLLEIMDLLYTEEEVNFINKAFRKRPSLTMEQLKKYSGMPEREIQKNIESLAKKGAVFISESSSGLMIYRILPLMMVGVFEYTFMDKIEYTEKEKKIAKLFERLFDEVRDVVQERYDQMVPVFRQMPPIDRTVPNLEETGSGEEITIEVNEELDTPAEQVLPVQNVEKIIDKFEDIAVAHCFCRQHKQLLGDECEQDPPDECCFTFGKSARFVSSQGFGRLISKEEAKKIIKECEEANLVHKAYHPHGKIERDETSLCNCCKDCCGTFDLWRNGATPMVNATNYLSQINQDLCVGCGTCVSNCPVGAISLNDEQKADRKADYCIGCGICARGCPEGAISMLEGQRTVYVPPPRVRE
ncbi:MAG: 4Fe-4S binding protein [Promethearchaeia archaeon]